MSSLDLHAVDAALRKTTERLAAELAHPTATAPDWSPFEWRVARAAVCLHGVSALLSRSLRWQEPVDWMQFLENQHAHTARRHQRLQDAVNSIGHRASLEGIPIVPLKGAALHAMGLYEAGTRPMADLDLLVRGQDHDAAARMLESLGFEEAYETAKHRVFKQMTAAKPAALGEHADNCIQIELHHRGVWEALPVTRVEITRSLQSSLVQPGLNDYPTIAALMTHLLLHTAGMMTGRGVRLLHLVDIARVASRMTGSDWTELGTPWWMWPPLALTARYFRGIPEQLLAGMAATCPRRMRRAYGRGTISNASLSALWLTPFPGMLWARSPGDVIEYIRERAFLRRDIARARHALVAEPSLAGMMWSPMSRAGRFLRMAVSRQPRAMTLNAVRAAIALPH